MANILVGIAAFAGAILYCFLWFKFATVWAKHYDALPEDVKRRHQANIMRNNRY